jgi:hypothetical protein
MVKAAAELKPIPNLAIWQTTDVTVWYGCMADDPNGPGFCPGLVRFVKVNLPALQD